MNDINKKRAKSPARFFVSSIPVPFFYLIPVLLRLVVIVKIVAIPLVVFVG